MLGKKLDGTSVITIEVASMMYEKHGVVFVVTDGQYVQIDSEK